MSPALFARATALFRELVECSPDERVARLDLACAGDLELRALVAGMLASDADESGLLGEEQLARGREQVESALHGARDEPARAVPSAIGPYRIVRRVGEGGMGVVYEALQDSPRRRVALKVSRPMLESDALLRRFRLEAEVLGRLEHSGIARIYQAGTFESGGELRPYFAMEFVEGEPITAFAERKRLPARERLALVARVCAAVQHAHERGVVHRDIKPDNVLVRGDGSPVVLDFGVARLANPSTVLTTMVTAQGEILGTLAYMAPEQLEGDADAITPRADVYALGVLLFELLGKRLPHDLTGLPLPAALRVLTEREPPRLGTLDTLYVGDIETIVGKALEVEPARRYASAAALAADLDAHLAYRPIAARPPSLGYRLQRLARRNQAIFAGAISTLTAVAAGLVVALVLLARESSLRAEADANALRARAGERGVHGHVLDLAQERLEAGKLAEAVGTYARVAIAEPSWDKRLLERALPAMLPAGLSPRQAEWLDEMHVVAPAGPGGGAAVIDVRGMREVRRLLPGVPLDSAQSLGSGVVLCSSRSQRIEAWFVDSTSGEVRLHLADDSAGGLTQFVGAAPRDGALVAARRGELAKEVVVWRGGEESLRVPVSDASWFPKLSADGRVLGILGNGGQLRLHDAESGELLAETSGLYPNEGGRIEFWLGRGAVLAMDADTTLVALDLSDLRRVRRWPAIRPPAYSGFGLSTDGALLSLRSGGRTAVWELDSDRLAWSEQSGVLRESEGVTRISPAGSRILVADHTTAAVLLDLGAQVPPFSPGTEADPRVRTYRAHSSYVYQVALSPDGRVAATMAPDDRLLRVFDLCTLETIAELSRGQSHGGESDRGHLLAFSPDGRRLLCTTRMPELPGTRLAVWNLLEGTVESEALAAGLSSASHLPWLDRFLEVLGPAPPMRLARKAWLLADGTALAVQQVGGRQVPVGRSWRAFRYGNEEEGLALSPDLRRVVLARSRDVSVCDLASEVELARFPGQAYGAAWSPDGRMIAVGGVGGRIRLIDGEHLVELYDFHAHDDYVFSLAWTPDSQQLVSCSGDKTVRVWDPRTPDEREADYAPYRALLEELRALGDAELRARFDAAQTAEARCAAVRVVLERREGAGD